MTAFKTYKTKPVSMKQTAVKFEESFSHEERCITADIVW